MWDFHRTECGGHLWTQHPVLINTSTASTGSLNLDRKNWTWKENASFTCRLVIFTQLQHYDLLWVSVVYFVFWSFRHAGGRYLSMSSSRSRIFDDVWRGEEIWRGAINWNTPERHCLHIHLHPPAGRKCTTWPPSHSSQAAASSPRMHGN